MLHIYFYCLFMIQYFLQTSHGKQNPLCSPSACGHIHNISYPFRLKNDQKHCGNPNYELACEENTTFIYFNSHKYLVQAINYHNYTIRLTDPAITNDTCSFPSYSLSSYKFSFHPYRYFDYDQTNNTYSVRSPMNSSRITRSITFMSCPYRVMRNSVFLLETTHCFNESDNRRRSYIKFGDLNGSYVMNMCRIDLQVMTSLRVKDENNVSLSEIHSSLVYGFELSWFYVFCGGCRYCYFDSVGKRTSCDNWCGFAEYHVGLLIIKVGLSGAVLNLALRIIIGMPITLGFLIYKLRRRHLSMFDVIEGFLRSNNNLMPIRYSYSDIKKITRDFREKLGEGGYGSVYKGKLRSGLEVAVKVLSKPRANGQDFINEVATIGRIHHVNVVNLVGYCAERSKRALVYDFMTNGSLEKYIFNRERTSNSSLSWARKYEIAIGVAHGIEYLHRGCDIQILHFDIKPHNILLDDNFIPKISDFGLAKYFSTEKDTVTLTAARGTIGYVAPELINRSIGQVSHKADVYSFGMLLMEMVGMKRDMVGSDNESSKYFPYWIYDQFNKGKDIEIGSAGENGEEDDDEYARKIIRKMTIVGLWCIQMSPSDRPSMNEVLKMFECDDENLELPSQPSSFPSNFEQIWETESNDSIALLGGDASTDE